MERLQERPGVTLPEEAPGVGDPEPRRGPVLEPGEVVEVASVRDRADDSSGCERAHLVRNRVGDAGHSICIAGDEPADLGVRRLLRAGGGGVGSPVRVRDQGIAQVGEPARSGRALDGRADEVD